ncbi:hypothetical protein [Solicola gregarius]|uniref:Uncharacterized protein n=1 Tax=Solicola gregarius TaxID=2908642 RepID=A0AA46TJM0_9ACTN|nr:hypothetical protein [Solicola gregarius]UYM06079.1 hypothetical protein L0C25_03120 [Solicola gregarius]
MAEPETHDEAVDWIFARVAEDRAERLAQPISEVEIDEAMAALDRAERLRDIQVRVRAGMVAKYGRTLTYEESDAMTRAVVKGRLPGPDEMETFEPAIQQQLRLAAAEYAQRPAHWPR